VLQQVHELKSKNIKKLYVAVWGIVVFFVVSVGAPQTSQSIGKGMKNTTSIKQHNIPIFYKSKVDGISVHMYMVSFLQTTYMYCGQW